MKFAKLFSLFAFVAVLSLFLVSAQPVLAQASCCSGVLAFTPVSISQSVVAGQTTNVNFNLTYNGTATPAALTWSSSPGITIQSPPTSISPGQTISLSATLSVPVSASGTINSVINVSVPSSNPESLPITITVTQPSSNLTLSASPTTPVSINQNVTFTLTNTGSSTLPTVTISETSSPLFGATFTPTSISNLETGASNAKTFQARVLQGASGVNNLKFGFNTVSIKAESASPAQVTTSSFQVKKTFCSSGETLTGNLTIDDVNWDNSGEGDEDSWELLDEIEVEMQIQNNNQDDDVDVIAEIGLFDSNGNNVADDLMFTDESDSDNEEIEINIDDDSDETVTWVFKVPADMDVGSYRLAVKAYDDDNGQSSDCRDSASEFSDSFFQTIRIEEASDEGRFVVVDEIELDNQVSCGQTVSGQFTVFNVGDEDQDRVRILIRNQNLGISLTREITSDLDQGEEESLDFSFTVPATAQNGNYVLEFITEYDYRNGVYREESEDSFDASFEVLGCSGNLGSGSGSLTNIAIDAELASDAMPGEELVVVATITNTGSEDREFTISARGYASWAELVDISDSTISVDAGESEEVTLTMIVNEDASGLNSFDLQVTEDGRVQIQEIEVELSGSSSAGGIFSSENSLIWVIGAINLVLIILIIVVAVRMSRR